MVYEKAMAEVILFDNSDVITASGCDNGNNKGQGHFHSGGIMEMETQSTWQEAIGLLE